MQKSDLILTEDGDYVNPKGIVALGPVKSYKKVNNKGVESTYWKFLMKSSYNSYSSLVFLSEEKANEAWEEAVALM